MAISTFPVAESGGGGGLVAYKGNPGSNAVNISAGFYLVKATEVNAFPITVGTTEIASGTTQIILDSNATNLEFVNEPVFLEKTGPGFASLAHSFGTQAELFVVARTGGEIASSPDGVTWTSRTTPTTNFTQGGVPNAPLVVIGAGDDILTSSDGITYTLRTSNLTDDVQDVAYDDGLYVASSRSGQVSTSPDGASWTARNTGFTSVLYGAGAGDGLYLVCGNSGTIITSPDGVTWTQQTSGTTERLYDIDYGNGLYVVVGSDSTPFVATSPDGTTWTQRTIPPTSGSLRGLVFSDGLWIATGVNGLLLSSTDGINWTELQAPNNTSENIIEGAFGNGLIMVGGDGYIATTTGLPTGAQYLVLEPTELTDLT